MTDVSAFEELSSLLDLMGEQWEHVNTPKTPQLLAKHSRFYGLLNGWSKRTSVSDQQRCLSKFQKKYIELNSIGVALWGGEQTLKYPKHTPWNTQPKLENLISSLFYDDVLDYVDQVVVALDLYTLNPNENLIPKIADGLPSWAFTNPKTRSKVVDFYVQAFSFATAKKSYIIKETLDNTQTQDFKQIADDVQKRCTPHVQQFLKLHSLSDMLYDAGNTWKKQKQLLTELGEPLLMDDENFYYSAYNGFLKNPQLMVQWLEYAAEHWSAQSFKRLTDRKSVV